MVHGPVAVATPVHPLIRTQAVTSAVEMLQACLKEFEGVDILVMAAAVADYTPSDPAAQKIKKTSDQDEGLVISLKKTTDILSELSQRRNDGQFLVGFALETENEEVHALSKLKKKNLDMIVLNSLRDEGAGFGTDTNKITVFDRYGRRNQFPCNPKSKLLQTLSG